MKPLSKGDPCRVRILAGGAKVDAIYIRHLFDKDHLVNVNGLYFVAIGFIPKKADPIYAWARFIGPAGVR